ncbi:MAG: hypothetical protein M1835_000991 [Candelina submexicana]|nr:MAG: hypothetical protein M1835_000991 [Candelina submexicana]
MFNKRDNDKSDTTVETASVAPSEATTLVPDQNDGMQRFTATGRPMPNYNPSALASGFYGPFGGEAVQHLPSKFTDDSIIHVPIPVDESSTSEIQQKERKQSWVRKIGDGIRGKKTGQGKFRMVKMTRGEYLKYWAKDEEGRYIGTEPEGLGRELWRDK